MDDDFNLVPDDDSESGGDEWLATYGDLVTLLLCFFVLLFAMSSVDAKKFQEVSASLNGSFSGGSSIGLKEGGESVIQGFEIPKENINNSSEAEDTMDQISKEVKEMVAAEKLESEITVKKEAKGIVITFKDGLLFDNGQSVLKSEVKNMLYSFSKILKKYGKTVRIEGHTDNVPINNNKFYSNWELSASRSINVVKYFTDELPVDERINPINFEVAGLGEHSPVAPNDTDENRQKNRRIEIVVLK